MVRLLDKKAYRITTGSKLIRKTPLPVQNCPLGAGPGPEAWGLRALLKSLSGVSSKYGTSVHNIHSYRPKKQQASSS